jgi:2-succinyl-6-hydroxy-2,4-cyclohexadiene-1-carboxylate synthase
VLSLGAMPDRLPALAANRVPLVAMAGELDRKFHALAVGIAERVPLARAVIVPGAGHNVPLEAPAAVAAALVELAGEVCR